MIPCTYERYGIVYCTLCDKAITYCRCGTTPAEDAPPEDKDDTPHATIDYPARGTRRRHR